MQTVILLLGVGLFAAIAYGDLRSRRIANGLSIAVAILIASKFGGPLRHLLPAAAPAAAEPPAPPTVPYGVAIALAGVLILVLQSSVPR